MKLSSRIVVPILLAVVTAGGLVGLLWWQVQASTLQVQKELRNMNKIMEKFETDLPVMDIGIAGDRALLHLRKGDLLALQGEWSEAQDEYEESIDQGGGLPALRKLAQAQLQRRDIEGAKSTLRKLESAGARPEDLLLLESIIHLRTGELEEAKKILEAAEESPQKHYGLALLRIMQGDHTQASVELGLVTKGWEPVLRSYAEIIQSGYEEYALFPSSPPFHRDTLVARALAHVQECEIALPMLLAIIQEQDDYRDAWVVQGYCELTTERLPEALASFERAYALDPEKPEIQYFLGRAHASLGDHQNALTYLQYSLTNGFQPEKEVRRLIAKEALAVQNPSLALTQYESLLTHSGAEIETYENYVTVAVALGKKDEAYLTAVKAVETWPSDAEAHSLLGLAAIELDKKDEAKAELEKALELDPTLDSAKERMKRL